MCFLSAFFLTYFLFYVQVHLSVNLWSACLCVFGSLFFHKNLSSSLFAVVFLMLLHFLFALQIKEFVVAITTMGKGCNLWSLKVFLVTFIFSFMFVWILHYVMENSLNYMEFNNNKKMKRRNILTFKDKSLCFLGSNLLNFPLPLSVLVFLPPQPTLKNAKQLKLPENRVEEKIYMFYKIKYKFKCEKIICNFGKFLTRAKHSKAGEKK